MATHEQRKEIVMEKETQELLLLIASLGMGLGGIILLGCYLVGGGVWKLWAVLACMGLANLFHLISKLQTESESAKKKG